MLVLEALICFDLHLHDHLAVAEVWGASGMYCVSASHLYERLAEAEVRLAEAEVVGCSRR